MPTDIKPSAATNASALDGTERVPCAQGGASRALTPAQVAAYLASVIVLHPFGTRAAPGIAFTDAPSRGAYGANNGLHIAVGGTNIFGVNDSAGGSGGAFVRSTALLGFSAGDPDTNAPDTATRREAAGVQLDTNGSTGLGFRLTGRVVEASTAGSGAPNLLAAIESRKLLTNEGATAEAYHTLPSAAAGIEFTFVCVDTDGIRIVANTGDTIRLGGAVSAAAGYVRAAVLGNSVTLLAVNATEWIATSIVGTWTIDI
jgi:hypothetical protein